MDQELTEEMRRHMRMSVSVAMQLVEAVKRQAVAREQRDRDRAMDLMRESQREHARWMAEQREQYRRLNRAEFRNAASLREWGAAYAAARGQSFHDQAAAATVRSAQDEIQRRFDVDAAREFAQQAEAAEAKAEVLAMASSYVDRLSDPEWVAQADRKEWVTLYSAARAMEDDDPRARAASDRAREELRSRFGVDADEAYSQVLDSFRREEALADSKPAVTPADTEAVEVTIVEAQDREERLHDEAEVIEAELVPHHELAEEEAGAKLAAAQNGQTMTTSLTQARSRWQAFRAGARSATSAQTRVRQKGRNR